ncbi:hypothetical protein J5N58_08210 [Rhizobium cremeum]|uniref:helix-turn-helix transcriptional regulator n=1 Tax=Rhizobium cremeum TaxID=2813827 RepID=UPI001FD3683D|nr:hypothetical protein [Rhizobium cremeum]MCJ7995904.1 hypothetical protein [Rhizobium cremeum]MCJ7999659.1 hypothetical protein [Rhizobium cremeum]
MKDGPRLLSRKDAATYCGIAESTFSMWISTHKMPPAVPGTRKWDKRAIDAKLDEISGLGGPPPDKPETDLQRWKRERDQRRSGKS